MTETRSDYGADPLRPRPVRVLDRDAALPADVSTGDVVELRGRGLHRVRVDPMTGVAEVERMKPRDTAQLAIVTVVGCETCRAGTPVGHLGSYVCRSGSLRAGGTRSHCTCDTCF